MAWLTKTFSTSVGKKQLMALTGFLFLLFLAVHLAGNFTLYGGQGAFTAYSRRLHELGALLAVAEIIMLIAAVVHISLGLVLFVQNRRARPVAYAVDKSGGGRTLSSRTMPYTGLLILAFVVLHLLTFSRFFVNQEALGGPYQVVRQVFAQPLYVLVYLAAMVVVALHVRHGLWSAFQTLGASHPKYTPFIETLSVVFAVVVGVGFASLPVVMSFMR